MFGRETVLRALELNVEKRRENILQHSVLRRGGYGEVKLAIERLARRIS